MGRMRLAYGLAVLGAISASCFSPNLGDEPILCGDGGVCPSGYECDRGRAPDPVCVREGTIPDAGIDAAPPPPDAALVDGPPPDGRVCNASTTECQGSVL